MTETKKPRSLADLEAMARDFIAHEPKRRSERRCWMCRLPKEELGIIERLYVEGHHPTLLTHVLVETFGRPEAKASRVRYHFMERHHNRG